MSKVIYVNNFWKEITKKAVVIGVSFAAGYYMHYFRSVKQKDNRIPISELEQIIDKYQTRR